MEYDQQLLQQSLPQSADSCTCNLERMARLHQQESTVAVTHIQMPVLGTAYGVEQAYMLPLTPEASQVRHICISPCDTLMIVLTQ
jgi:hypothetical protein